MKVAAGTRLVLLLALLAGVTGCDRRDEKITVYRVEKAPIETSPAAQPDSGALGPRLPASDPIVGRPATAVPVPPNWEPQPPSQMRQASFLVHGENGAVADISLVTLGTTAGDVLGNVNRWLGQLGQPAVTEEQLPKMVQQLPSDLGQIAVVDLVGKPEQGDATKDGRIIAAMGTAERGTSFFKMRGNAALVGAEKENFLKWVSAARGGDSAAGSNVAPPSLGPADVPKIKWQVPEGWMSGPPAPMRYASFNTATANGEKAEISVVTFPGEGGSDADNINRWRQQIGLPPADAGTMPSLVHSVKGNATEFASVDLDSPKTRVVAAWVRRDGRSWFFKLSGAPDAVENERVKFVSFLQSVQF